MPIYPEYGKPISDRIAEILSETEPLNAIEVAKRIHVAPLRVKDALDFMVEQGRAVHDGKVRYYRSPSRRPSGELDGQ